MKSYTILTEFEMITESKIWFSANLKKNIFKTIRIQIVEFAEKNITQNRSAIDIINNGDVLENPQSGYVEKFISPPPHRTGVLGIC